MGPYYELEDPDFSEKSYRRSPSPRKFAQLLSKVPFWAALAGGLAIGKMLSRFSGSSRSAKGSDRDIPMNEGPNMEGFTCGPWGGAGGTPFYDGRGDIVEIQVTHNADHVLGLETSYNQGPYSFKAGPHGTSGDGGQVSKITIQYPDEYIVQVTGTTNQFATIQAPIVLSLTVVTNKQSYGPYGKASGTAFVSLLDSRVVGFFGKSGTLLDQLGVLVQPSDSYLRKLSSFDIVKLEEEQKEKEQKEKEQKEKEQKKKEQKEKEQKEKEQKEKEKKEKEKKEKEKKEKEKKEKEKKEEELLGVEGPRGRDVGTAFHDGHGRVAEIVVTYHKHQINSLQVSYEHGALPFQGPVHGVPAGQQTKILFHRPEEYLIEVKGTAGKVSGHDTITSLTFITNQRHFGPFGHQARKAFESSPALEEKPTL